MHTRRQSWLNRPGRAPGLCGVLLLAQLAVLRLVAAADANSVTVAGRTLHWDCWFRTRFDRPCPTCGLTRSVLLTLHGQLRPALALNWAGPLLVAGLALLGCTLVGLLLCQQTPAGRAAAAWLQHRLRAAAPIYAALFAGVLLAHWLVALRAP